MSFHVITEAAVAATKKAEETRKALAAAMKYRNGFDYKTKAELVRRLVKVGAKVKWTGDATRPEWRRLEVNGESVNVELKEEDRGGYRFRGNGKFRLTVRTGYGDWTSYPVLKTGSYNWEKIVAKILGAINAEATRRAASKKAEEARKANTAKVKALKAEYGYSEYESNRNGVCLGTSDHSNSEPRLMVYGNKVEEVLKVLRTAGMI